MKNTFKKLLGFTDIFKASFKLQSMPEVTAILLGWARGCYNLTAE